MSSKLSVEFEEKTVSARGRTFKFREITGGDYDDIVKVSTGPDGEAQMGAVLKLMVVKSCIDPKLTAEEYAAYPLPLVRLLNDTVSELHFSPAVADTTPAPGPNA